MYYESVDIRPYQGPNCDIGVEVVFKALKEVIKQVEKVLLKKSVYILDPQYH